MNVGEATVQENKRCLSAEVSKSHGLTKSHSGRHRYDMALFIDWLVRKDVTARLRLLEHAEYFDPQAYNQVFESEREKLLHRIHEPKAQQQLKAMRGFDWANYISRSLLRAGFKDDEEQEAFHAIAIRLLIEPGRLFAGWNPNKHGPMEQRFKRSVWNSIRNIIAKTLHRRKWMVTTDPVAMAGQYAGRQPYSSLIDEFRTLVAQRLGKHALAILDARLSGEKMKILVGKTELGTPSAFFVKREVAEIKRLAEMFAARLGDPAFSGMVMRAMEGEAETVAKRQRSMVARGTAPSSPQSVARASD